MKRKVIAGQPLVVGRRKNGSIFALRDTCPHRAAPFSKGCIIKNNSAQFVCRRGGETDRNVFVDFGGLVKEFCGKDCTNHILFEGEKEWPMFNTGVFIATSDAVKKIRKNSVQFTYEISLC